MRRGEGEKRGKGKKKQWRDHAKLEDSMTMGVGDLNEARYVT